MSESKSGLPNPGNNPDRESIEDQIKILKQMKLRMEEIARFQSGGMMLTEEARSHLKQQYLRILDDFNSILAQLEGETFLASGWVTIPKSDIMSQNFGKRTEGNTFTVAVTRHSNNKTPQKIFIKPGISPAPKDCWALRQVYKYTKGKWVQIESAEFRKQGNL